MFWTGWKPVLPFPVGGCITDFVCQISLETRRQDMDALITPPVWVPLAAGPPVRAVGTGSKLPVAPENPDLGGFFL